MNFQTPINTRRSRRMKVGRFRGGRLNPIMSEPVKPNEGGVLSQSVYYEFDPIAGRLVTPPTVHLIAVFVPNQAIDVLAAAPNDTNAGLTDVLRQKMVSGSPVFTLEAESEISKRCEVNPISINGVKRVNQSVRLAHNAAVNHLRLRLYDKAPRVAASNAAVTPALLSATVLERLNGVLDPDDRINGAVQLSFPTMNLPVTGIGFETSSVVSSNAIVRDADLGQTTYTSAVAAGQTAANTRVLLNRNATTNRPEIFAKLNASTAGNVSLDDFYNAQKADRLVREMQNVLKQNPEYGAEALLNWAHGLSVENGITPWVLAEQTPVVGVDIVGAMYTAGVQNETMRSDMSTTLSFTVPVPRTELGGQIITFAVMKPDESLSGMPHPILTKPFGGENFVSAQMALDPRPVTVREMDMTATAANETDILFYTGLNELARNYVDYGLSLNLDPATIVNKTAFWQYKIPLSVTPQSILYPADLPHFPFANQSAEVVTYTVTSTAIIRTPMVFGPTPEESLPTVVANDIFDGVL